MVPNLLLQHLFASYFSAVCALVLKVFSHPHHPQLYVHSSLSPSAVSSNAPTSTTPQSSSLPAHCGESWPAPFTSVWPHCNSPSFPFFLHSPPLLFLASVWLWICSFVLERGRWWWPTVSSSNSWLEDACCFSLSAPLNVMSSSVHGANFSLVLSSVGQLDNMLHCISLGCIVTWFRIRPQ